ncbi:MAG: hypothetical protein MI802_00585, partial [Desulfobacterales bacterium]|nr:hypothetical protein [Desulfobacterales bacterium]
DRETADDTDELTLNIQPGLRYKFDEDLVLRTGVRFTSVEDREDDTASERSLIFLTLKKEFDL